MSAVLTIKDLSVALSDRERRFTLKVPELQLGAGEVVGLSGKSGTGKTMLLEVLGLLRRPAIGSVYKIERPTYTLDLVALWTGKPPNPPDVRGADFGFVPQSGGLLPFLSVSENIALSQRIADRPDGAWQTELVETLGLSDIQSLLPGALSIGQRQRVSIARALAHRPAFVIADEPTAALDPTAAETAMGLLIEAAMSGGAGVIISSHDLALLDRFPMRRLGMSLTSSPGSTEVESQLGELEVAS